MRAIIWKELRENLKWAVLCLVGMAVTIGVVLYQMSGPYSFRTPPLLDDGFQAIVICGAAGVALLLGLLQTIPELRRDRWAFLVHRPLTPTRLFFAKSIAGLVLYLMAVLLPLLGAAVWVATSGHIQAYFEWRMILPGVAGIIGGMGFYFAALLAGVRQARWYGSRALPFVLAASASGVVVGLPEFWEAALVAIAITVILMTAAWGSFIASGQYRSQPALAKAALGLTLWSGIAFLGSVGVIVLEQVLMQHDTRKGTWSHYQIDDKGRILRVTKEHGGRGQVTSRVTDLAGNPVDQGKGASQTQPTSLRFAYISGGTNNVMDRSYRSRDRFIHSLTGQRDWQYVRPRRVVIAYDNQSGDFIGTLSPAGFSPPGEPAEDQFPDERLLNDYWRQEEPLLIFPSGVYYVDYHARRVRLLLAGTREEPIVGANQMWTDSNQPGYAVTYGSICVVTARRVYMFPDPSKPPVVLESPFRPEEYPNLRVAVMPKGGYVIWYETAYARRPRELAHEQVVFFSATGGQERYYDLPPLPWSLSRTPTWRQMCGWFIAPIALLVEWFGFQLIAILAWSGVPEAVMQLRHFQQEFFGALGSFWIPGVGRGGTVLLGAACWALMVYWLGRRYAFSRRQLRWWTIGGFFLGPAGLLMLLALREWPARVACASCGRLRVVDRERCEHCGAGFPPPARTGIEIIEKCEAPSPIGIT